MSSKGNLTKLAIEADCQLQHELHKKEAPGCARDQNHHILSAMGLRMIALLANSEKYAALKVLWLGFPPLPAYRIFGTRE
jgi:hypothetical protein